MDKNFSVCIEDFAEKHFIKSFERKYKGHWDLTLKAIVGMLERVDTLLTTSKAETICTKGSLRFIKIEFRVFNTSESAKTSGNRCIAVADFETKEVRLLLLYNKTHLRGHNETVEWQSMVKDNYLEFKDFF